MQNTGQPLVPTWKAIRENYERLWTITAQNCNKPGFRISNIAGAVDREDLHQILILTLNIYFSLSRFHSSLRRRAAETSLTCDAGSTFWNFQDRSRNHRIMCEQKPHSVWWSAQKLSGSVTLMGVFTYNRNSWQTQGKWLYAHERVIGALVRNETSIGRKWKLIKPLCLVNRVFVNALRKKHLSTRKKRDEV